MNRSLDQINTKLLYFDLKLCETFVKIIVYTKNSTRKNDASSLKIGH